MKKIVTLSLFVALCSSMYADKISILTLGLGVPGGAEPQFMGLGMSANGKYACGAIENGTGIFVADAETGDIEWTFADSDDGGELRHVDNNGVAIGFTDYGITYSFATSEMTPFSAPEGFRGILGEDLTNDGSIMVGSASAQSFTTSGAYCMDGETWKLLPIPSAEELGELGKDLKGSAAKRVSGDGKVILGFLGSFGLPILWFQNEAGEYEADFFPARYVKASQEDLDNKDKEFYSLSGMYLNMSNNGRYIVLIGLIKDEKTGEQRSVPVVYDVVEKKMNVYNEVQEVDEAGAGLYPTAICDDGTFIGTVGQPYFHSSGTFIMEAGETQAKLYVDVFPEYAAKVGVADGLGFNMPTAMSADGRYLLGYTYYCEDYNNEFADAYYVTYVLDTEKGSAGIDDIVNDSDEAQAEAIYGADGIRRNDLTKGLNIVRMSDGSVRKIVKQ